MIKIEYRPDMMGYFIYEFRGGANNYREYKNREGNWVQVKEGESVEPTYYIEDLVELATAIRDAGVKLPSDHKLEGVLEAQTKHLEDMRTLVFKRGK